MRCSLSLLLLGAHALSVRAASAADWRSRSVYQVLTDRFARDDGSTGAPCNTGDKRYCGGTWRGIINKLDYIQNMGFTAIWISPITHNIPGSSDIGSSFHGYWQDDIYSLNQNFGTADDLKALSAALHKRGMYLMVDVVTNHFAWEGLPDTVDYSKFRPFNSASYFHKSCPITDDDYARNQTAVEECWIGGGRGWLPDVITTRQDVKDTYYSWIRDLVNTYSIDGLRIDTIKHVQKDFWPGFNKAANVYCVGEVANGDFSYTCPYQNYLDGVLNYPLYYQLTNAFRGNGDMTNLVNVMNAVKTSCKDSTLLAPFSENHDQPRFPSYTDDMALDQNVIAFSMLSDGIPMIYEGQEQHYNGGNDPYDREAVWLSGYNTGSTLYRFITAVNRIRTRAIQVDNSYLTYKADIVFHDASTIAMRKGPANAAVVSVFTNVGANGGSFSRRIENTGFSAGSSIIDILTCNAITADSTGAVTVSISRGAPQILYPADKLRGSNICGR